MKKIFITMICVVMALVAVYNPYLAPGEKAHATSGNITSIVDRPFSPNDYRGGVMDVTFTSSSSLYYMTQEDYYNGSWYRISSQRVGALRGTLTFSASSNARYGDQYRYTLSTKDNKGGIVLATSYHSLRNDYGTLRSTTIGSLTSLSTSVTGLAEANSTVTIRNGTTVLGSGTANSSRQYTISIPAQPAGSTITATAVLGNLSAPAVSTIVQPATLEDTTLDSLTNQSTSASGTAHPGATVRIENGTTVIGTGTADNNGDYTIPIPAQAVGTVVTAQATFNNVSSNIASRTVTSAQTVGTITPNRFNVGDMNITGTYTDDVVRARVWVNGASINIGGDFDNGNFSFFVGNAGIKAGDIVTIQALDFNNRILDTQQLTVVSPLPQGTIRPSDYTVGTTAITGSYTGAVTSARLEVDGRIITAAGGTFRADGTFTYFVSPGTIRAGARVELIALDVPGGRVLDRQLVNVIANSQGTITPANYRVGDANITGTYTGDVTSARLLVNNNVVTPAGGTFNADGTFTFFVRSGAIRFGDDVELIALDAPGGRELDRKTVSVLANTQGTITPANYRVGDANITGTYTGDITSARLLVNRNIVTPAGGTFNADGTFTFFVRSGVIRAGDDVELIALDAPGGRELDRSTVTIASTQGTITPNSFRVVQGNSNITGTYTGDVTSARLLVNNNVVIPAGGTFNADGTFTFFVRSGTIQVGDDVELIALDAPGGRVLDRSPVTIALTQGTLTANAYKVGETNITGTYTGDVASARLVVNNNIITAGGGTFTNGTFSYFVRAGVIQAGDDVTLIALDANDRELYKTTVRVNPNIQGTITLDNYTAGGANLTGTYTGDVARGRITVNGVVGNWGGTFNLNGTFSYYVGNLGLQTGDVVKLTGFSLDHTELDDSTITVQ
ncbi:immunoglobulin-like domain-containing protein [Paenilisteria rocourtiae]|uniref:Bacterial Ig domain-containing protein n=1 Tax=Listeria rocourtiae TaxID=647910 RepID=A0A4R6ZK10_9LIST|nr:immunoglobulin-like domain-containing protein [Listeria rocourtiae]EUJ47793.1 lipoprotein [Listeria rocourtiae FSL F6-920]MBC1604613.1 hypothetical protein [Listeria rocourtiae]TDR52565.1 hypothetical protein DFP96_1072 [Listeria rocourtiae]